MKSTLLLLALLLIAAPVTAKGRVIEITDARAMLNGAKEIGFEFSVRYNGNEKMANRLHEGRYLELKSILPTFMDKDLVVDDQLTALTSFRDEWTPRPVKRDEVKGEFWDVLSNPTITFKRTYTLEGEKFRKVAQPLFKHEAVRGRTSWFGRLHRSAWGPYEDGSTVDEHGAAALFIGDALYTIIARIIPTIARGTTTAVLGKDFRTPDVFSDVDVYFIIDARFKDSLGFSYRTVFQTNPISLSPDMATVDVSRGDTEYSENGVTTVPGFTDLHQ